MLVGYYIEHGTANKSELVCDAVHRFGAFRGAFRTSRTSLRFRNERTHVEARVHSVIGTRSYFYQKPSGSRSCSSSGFIAPMTTAVCVLLRLALWDSGAAPFPFADSCHSGQRFKALLHERRTTQQAPSTSGFQMAAGVSW